ncbi:MAG: ribonuclease Y [Candidatus Omnitrophica bacterium]|nr:ribonuclease Y [Candidatus Omnitrophota bacterium]
MSLKTVLLSPQFTLIGIGLICLGLGYLLRRLISERDIRASEVRVRTIIQTAHTQAAKIRREAEIAAKDYANKARQEFNQESQIRREEIANLDRRLVQREAGMDSKVDLLDEKERKLAETAQQLAAQEDALVKKQEELNTLVQEERTRLQKLSGLSAEEAKKLFLERLNTELTHEAAGLIRQKYEEVAAQADQRARELVTQAIQKCAVDAVNETTVSVITLPSEEMKGRIIGREGRNIRSLEMATGVDVVIDETPETVTLSGFDPIKREVARIALERLIEDGRIHPSRVEEVVAKVKQEMETTVKDAGEQATAELGIHNLHPELVKLVGKLKYRTSYGQNVLQHAKEVAYLAGYLAAELKLDVNIAKRAGLLHDIAKAVSQEMEGTQAEVGMQLLKKYGEKEDVIHAVEAHHQDIEAHSPYAVLVQAADAISAARPGARRESLDNYVKRLEKLEQAAKSFKGVSEAYAIQAGREVRVMVQPDQVDDAQTAALARDITKKIQATTDFPGQIKVTVIRELRATEYAR